MKAAIVYDSGTHTTIYYCCRIVDGNAGGFHDRIQQGRYQRDIQGWYGNSYRVTVARAKSRANFLVFLSYFMVK